MKTVQVQLVFIFLAFMLSIPSTFAVHKGTVPATEDTELHSTPISVDAMEVGATASKKELRKQKRLQKKQARMTKRIAKMQARGIDFNDPVKKWMWFWILGWALGIVLIIAGVAIAVGTSGFGIGGIMSLLGYLVMVFGSVSFVIWLVKMLSS